MKPSSDIQTRGSISRVGVALPGIGVALLPKLACPACWPAYSALLAALGLGWLLEETWLLPLTAGLLAIAIGSLGYRAGARRGYRPFVLGSLAGLLVLVGKFAFDNVPVTYAGASLLVAASIWNAWPVRSNRPCARCVEDPIGDIG